MAFKAPVGDKMKAGFWFQEAGPRPTGSYVVPFWVCYGFWGKELSKKELQWRQNPISRERGILGRGAESFGGRPAAWA